MGEEEKEKEMEEDKEDEEIKEDKEDEEIEEDKDDEIIKIVGIRDKEQKEQIIMVQGHDQKGFI